MGGGKYKKRRFYKTIEQLTFKNMVKYETDQLKSKFTCLFDKHQSKQTIIDAKSTVMQRINAR